MPGGYDTVPTGLLLIPVIQAAVAADVTYTFRMPCAGKIVAVDLATTTQNDCTVAVKNAGSDVVAAVALPASGTGARATLIEATRVVARGTILTVVLDFTTATVAGVSILIWIRPLDQIALNPFLD